MSQQARRLLQLGVLLLLLALLIGLAIAALAVPRLGVAAHVNGVIGAVFLFVLGLVWPQLRFGTRASGLAFWLAVYAFFMGALMPLLGGVWGAGGGMLPIAAGAARGSAFQEGVIAAGLTSAGVAVITLCVLLLRGLRAARES
jgi:hydroxylaminobenzene mutase